METVKIVFDVDSKDIKSTTDELKALNKVTNDEIAAMDKLATAAEDAGDGFVSLRTQVKQAKEEAQKAADKYGEFSKEANAARVKAGQLADQMGDLNRQVNLLNPEAKAKAFSNLAQGVVGAFAVATGALQAFGVKNKEVEQLAMKLQGALNITQGIASIGQLKESLADLKIVLGFTTAATNTQTAATGTLTTAKEADIVVTNAGTVANKTFTSSLLTNPIFLVVAAIGALVGAYIALNNETSNAILNEEELKKIRDGNKKLIDDEKNSAIDLLVAQKQISQQEGERRKIELQRKNDTEERISQEKKLADEQLVSQARLEKANKNLILLQKQLESTTREGAQNLLVERIGINQQIVDDETKKLNEIKIQRKVLADGTIAINKKALNDTKVLNIEERDENNKTAEAKTEKQKQEAEKRRKEQQAEWDKIMAEEEARAKIEADKIQERSKRRLALEKQLQDEINRARLLAVKGDKVGELQVQMDILDEKYANDLLNLQRTAQTDQEYAEAKAVLDKKYANDQTDLNNQVTNAAIDNAAKLAKAEKDAADKIIEQEKKKQQAKKEALQGIVDTGRFVAQTVSESDSRAREEEFAQLEDLNNRKIISEKEYQRRMRAIKQKQAEDNKKAALYQASLDLASALINALTYKPANTVPVAVVFAAAIAAANLAKIAATPIPRFQKGTLAVPGVDMGKDSVHAMLQPGEAVIPVQTNRAYHPTIKAIYEKKISPSEINNFVMSRTSSGGKQSVTANVDTYALSRALGKNKTVEVGNASVIGRAMAKELLRGQNYRRA